MVPSNIFNRTLFVKFEQYGTAFTIDYCGAEYLVTAKHLIDTSATDYSVQVYFAKKWNLINLELVGHGRGSIDASVFKFSEIERFTPKEFVVGLGADGSTVGQDMFFTGFPYKMHIDYGEPFGGLPGAFVKKGTVSSFDFDERAIYLDAINNDGFSGGPIFYNPNDGVNVAKIVGVVSRFRTENEAVMGSDGVDTGQRVRYNTGFLIGVMMGAVTDIIDAKLKSQSAGGITVF